MNIKTLDTEYGEVRYYNDNQGWWIDVDNGCGFVLEHGAETESDCIESALINVEEDRINNPESR